MVKNIGIIVLLLKLIKRLINFLRWLGWLNYKKNVDIFDREGNYISSKYKNWKGRTEW